MYSVSLTTDILLTKTPSVSSHDDVTDRWTEGKSKTFLRTVVMNTSAHLIEREEGP